MVSLNKISKLISTSEKKKKYSAKKKNREIFCKKL